jgi:hypothetical protein
MGSSSASSRVQVKCFRRNDYTQSLLKAFTDPPYTSDSTRWLLAESVSRPTHVSRQLT